MHVVKTSSPIRFPDGTQLAPGEWLCNDDNAFQIGLMATRASVRAHTWNGVNPKTNMWYWDQSKPEWIKSILLIRSGAIGDLLLLSPCIAALKAKYPHAKITLACFPRHRPIVQDMGFDAVIDYPVHLSAIGDHDLVIPLEHIVELSTEKGVHATDAYAEALGVSVIDYKPKYRVTDEETQWAHNAFKRLHDTRQDKWTPRIALHLQSSASIRNYPMELWQVVIQALIERGWEVMLLGNTVTMKGGPKGLHDCSRLSFREAAAVLATCDAFCGVDSSFFNLAPALGIPAVGLFGPVDWRTRVKEGNGQIALHGEGCEPCHWTNARAGVKMPPLMPCAPKQQCVLLSSIRPERIVAVVEREAKK